MTPSSQQMEPPGIPARFKTARNLYEARLKTVVPHVLPFEIRGENDENIYYLVFATRSPKGLAEMRRAMRAVDPKAGMRYSPKDSKDQAEMFPEARIEELALEMGEEFGTRTANVTAEVFRHQSKLPGVFLEKDYRAALRILETSGSRAGHRIEVVVGPTRRARRVGEYPRGTRVRFYRQEIDP